MLIRTEEPLWSDADPLFEDMDDILYSSLHSDDIWKKFEFLDIPASEFTSCSVANVPDDLDRQLDNLLEWSLDSTASDRATVEVNEIRHHDCMWAGHCGSKEHRPELAKSVVIPPVMAIATAAANACSTPQKSQPVVVKKVSSGVVMTTPTQGRSLLLRNAIAARTPTPTVVPAAVTVGPRPDSPPSSDDDDHPCFKHDISGIFEQPVNKTLQLLNDAISECDFDEDSDLCEYFEDSDVFVGTESSSSDGPRAYPGESDHSYHKGKGAQLRTDHLGVQTPSDSGEFSFCFFLICFVHFISRRNYKQIC